MRGQKSSLARARLLWLNLKGAGWGWGCARRCGREGWGAGVADGVGACWGRSMAPWDAQPSKASLSSPHPWVHLYRLTVEWHMQLMSWLPGKWRATEASRESL